MYRLPGKRTVKVLLFSGGGNDIVDNPIAFCTCNDNVFELASLRVLVELVLTPLVGLVGTVTGFYFGEKIGDFSVPRYARLDGDGFSTYY